MVKQIRDYSVSGFEAVANFRITSEQKTGVQAVAKAQGAFIADIYRRYIDEGLERDRKS